MDGWNHFYCKKYHKHWERERRIVEWIMSIQQKCMYTTVNYMRGLGKKKNESPFSSSYRFLWFVSSIWALQCASDKLQQKTHTYCTQLNKCTSKPTQNQLVDCMLDLCMLPFLNFLLCGCSKNSLYSSVSKCDSLLTLFCLRLCEY